MWRALKHYQRAQIQGHHNIDGLEESGAERETMTLEGIPSETKGGGGAEGGGRAVSKAILDKHGSAGEAGWSAYRFS